MSMPKIGMHYNDVRKKLKGPLGKDPSIASSLLNQCRLAEGDRAVNELIKEVSSGSTSSTTFRCSGNKQTGIGPGKKFGDGKWRYDGKKWKRVEG